MNGSMSGSYFSKVSVNTADTQTKALKGNPTGKLENIFCLSFELEGFNVRYLAGLPPVFVRKSQNNRELYEISFEQYVIWVAAPRSSVLCF